MNVTCTHCGKVNRVAGLRQNSFEDRLEGTVPNKYVMCCWCRKQFTPTFDNESRTAPEKENS